MIIQPMHTPTHPLPDNTVNLATDFLSGVCELTHWGVIRAVGEDAVKFLQSQLTQDVASMRLSEAYLAAFCNAKGRMQASFIVFKRSQQEVFLVCSRDILAQTRQRLSIFVMRAKVTLTDASAEFLLYGLAGRAVESALSDPSVMGLKADTDIDTGAGAAHQQMYLYPAAGQARALWCAPLGTPPPLGATLPPDVWAWLEVQSGIAMITQPIFEALVPQMLNYESVGGVSFKKGCYPGQEIVARSQFRGTIKRRAYLVHSSTQACVGQALFYGQDTEQPCGVVAACAPNPSGGFDALVSVQTAAAAGEWPLCLATPSGAVLTIQPLPYALLEDI